MDWYGWVPSETKTLVIPQPVGTQDSYPLECITPDDVLTQFDPPDDENLLLETCRGVK
jgi:hypothetical protein